MEKLIFNTENGIKMNEKISNYFRELIFSIAQFYVFLFFFILKNRVFGQYFVYLLSVFFVLGLSLVFDQTCFL